MVGAVAERGVVGGMDAPNRVLVRTRRVFLGAVVNIWKRHLVVAFRWHVRTYPFRPMGGSHSRTLRGYRHSLDNGIQIKE